jgi:hypothetical protein
MEATEEVALTTCDGMSAGEVSVCPAETLWSNDGAAGLLRCLLLGLAVVLIRDPAAAACSNEVLGHISLVHWRA